MTTELLDSFDSCCNPMGSSRVQVSDSRGETRVPMMELDGELGGNDGLLLKKTHFVCHGQTYILCDYI